MQSRLRGSFGDPSRSRAVELGTFEYADRIVCPYSPATSSACFVCVSPGTHFVPRRLRSLVSSCTGAPSNTTADAGRCRQASGQRRRPLVYVAAAAFAACCVFPLLFVLVFGIFIFFFSYVLSSVWPFFRARRTGRATPIIKRDGRGGGVKARVALLFYGRRKLAYCARGHFRCALRLAVACLTSRRRLGWAVTGPCRQTAPSSVDVCCAAPSTY